MRRTPAEGSPLYDPLAFPLSAETSIAPIDPRLWEFKKALLDLGYNFQVNYTGEVAANPVGGARQGADYEGLLELGIDGDIDRIAGLKGASFHINAFAIHGRGLTTYNVFNFSTISGIEARPTVRLFEAWFEQKLFGGLASVRPALSGDDARRSPQDQSGRSNRVSDRFVTRGNPRPPARSPSRNAPDRTKVTSA